MSTFVGPVAFVRLAFWTLTSRQQAMAQLSRDGTRPVRLRRPPSCRLGAGRTVERLLWMSRATCLVRSCVLQNWHAANGVRYDVVVGVVSPRRGFRAHAWLDRPGAAPPADFTEMMRIPCAEVAE